MSDRKMCCACSRWRPLSEFWRDRRRPDGLQCACKRCRRAIQRRYQYYQRGKEEARGYLLLDSRGQPWVQPPLPLD